MANFTIMNRFDIIKNSAFLEKAAQLSPKLYTENLIISPEEKAMKRGDSGLYDFGNHHVGYLSVSFSSRGSHPDAPAYIRIRMAEHKKEFDQQIESYDGWLGKGWFQEEYIHIDTFPARIEFPRRYAFRYVEIAVLDTSPKYQIVTDQLQFQTVSAVEENLQIPAYGGDELLQRIDEVGCHTLAGCMQSVFEDGPKRDRRMWLGDLRIQAITNYASFKNLDLVKRCLYIFAGLLFNDNQVSACVFMEPEQVPDDTFLIDYSLQFVNTLWEYYEVSKDLETVKDLYPVAQDQLQYAKNQLDERGLLADHPGDFWCFLDWGDELNKEAGANAVYACALQDAILLAETLGNTSDAVLYAEEREILLEAVNRHFFDEKKGVYISGAEKQVSRHSQIWMLLAGAVKDPETLLDKTEAMEDSVLHTPYAMYYYALALLKYGRRESAIKRIKEHWGGMIKDGADTFYEVYDEKNANFSPYGSLGLNSYCHAWSCGVVALLRKYFAE